MTTDKDAPAAGMVERLRATFTYEENEATGPLYYFTPAVRAPGPYRQQRHVNAIVDIAADGSFAGVELIDNMPPLAALQAPQEAGVAFRQIVEKAFNDPIEIWPTGWREKYPALTEPDTGTVHRRINDALSAFSQPVATPAPRPQLGTIPNYPEYDNARIK